MNVLNKQGSMFIINEEAIVLKYRTVAIKNALYAEVYAEFIGAAMNPKYKHMTSLEKFNKLNEFAENWLKNRGFINI